MDEQQHMPLTDGQLDAIKERNQENEDVLTLLAELEFRVKESLILHNRPQGAEHSTPHVSVSLPASAQE